MKTDTSVDDEVAITGEESVARQATGVYTATLVGFSDASEPLVTMPGTNQGVRAASTCVSLTRRHIGRRVVVSEDKYTSDPIIIGVIQGPANRTSESADEAVDVQVDGRRLTLCAEQEIVLACGEASITLTRAGKILLKGAYISGHSTGVNRIKGAVVEIN